METFLVYWGYMGIMETTIVDWGYIGITAEKWKLL